MTLTVIRYRSAVKAKEMQVQGFGFSTNGLIQSAVRVQRFIRAGFTANVDINGGLDGLIDAYAQHCLRSSDDHSFLDQIARAPPTELGSVTSYGWITRAIACSGSLEVRQAARAFDVAYSMTGNATSGILDAMFVTALAALDIDMNACLLGSTAAAKKKTLNALPPGQVPAAAEEVLPDSHTIAALESSTSIGSLSNDTATRCKMSLTTQNPTFYLSIRKGHLPATSEARIRLTASGLSR